MTTTIQDNRRQELFSAAEAKFGFLPNVLKQMGTSPAALEVYLKGQAALGNPGNRLTAEQRNYVQLATSERNDCKYCVAAHKTMGSMQGSDKANLAAVAAGESIANDAGGLYVEATRLIMEKQGHLDGQDIARLEAQGLDREVLYEIVASVGVKLISNWINHIAGTKVDAQFS
jgi:AhpD family alkylhydroperoxidase